MPYWYTSYNHNYPKRKDKMYQSQIHGINFSDSFLFPTLLFFFISFSLSDYYFFFFFSVYYSYKFRTLLNKKRLQLQKQKICDVWNPCRIGVCVEKISHTHWGNGGNKAARVIPSFQFEEYWFVNSDIEYGWLVYSGLGWNVLNSEIAAGLRR